MGPCGSYSRGAQTHTTSSWNARPSVRSPSVGRSWRVACKAQWLSVAAEREVSVPLGVAYKMWDTKTRIPEWMPIIDSVVIDQDDSKVSTWRLATERFGRSWELVWRAQNLAPLKGRKIHWHSVDGSMKGAGGLEVRNRGSIQFAPRGKDACSVRMTFEFEVPQPLVPFAGALTPFGNSVLDDGIKRFDAIASAEQEGAAKAESAA